MICYLIFSVLIAAAAFTVRRRSLLRLTGAAFYAVQAAFAVRIVAGGLYGETSAVWFAFDAAGTLFYCLLCIVSPSPFSTRRPASTTATCARPAPTRAC